MNIARQNLLNKHYKHRIKTRKTQRFIAKGNESASTIHTDCNKDGYRQQNVRQFLQSA